MSLCYCMNFITKLTNTLSCQNPNQSQCENIKNGASKDVMKVKRLIEINHNSKIWCSSCKEFLMQDMEKMTL